MNYLKKSIGIVFMVLIIFELQAQNDHLIYKEKKPGFYQDSILAGIKAFNEHQHITKPGIYLSLDFSQHKFPTDPNKYQQYWHNDPVSQGATGTCWCFASTSFMESEIFRITGKKVKLSEMYTVYWEYVARAEYFVKNHGTMFLGEGSESNAILRIMNEHGMMPKSVYNGLLPGQKYYDHSEMFKEIQGFLDNVKKENLWNKDFVVETIKSILDHFMGTPPEDFTMDGKTISPLEFMDMMKIKPDDYFCFMSTKSLPFNQKGVLSEPDNWWQSDDYYNVNLEDFFRVITDALDNKYTVSICGDVSEPGYDRYAEVAIVPTFDIPREYIDEDAREFRINNKTTTDDHCIHIVGYRKADNGYWFLIKDSSSSAFDGPHKGYRFIREDYMKLKVLAVMTYKYAAKDVLDKIIK